MPEGEEDRETYFGVPGSQLSGKNFTINPNIIGGGTSLSKTHSKGKELDTPEEYGAAANKKAAAKKRPPQD